MFQVAAQINHMDLFYLPRHTLWHARLYTFWNDRGSLAENWEKWAPFSRRQLLYRLTQRPSVPDFENKDTKTKQQLIATGLVAALDPGLQGKNRSIYKKKSFQQFLVFSRYIAHSGAYLSDCQIAVPAEHAQGRDKAERLWKISEAIAAQEFPI